ncbi:MULTISPECIES: histidinol-phosphate transaminase [unclassified Pseudomonas]|uniref:pyridoxal phosphate-dependent aminotransferase n=1 Tax=unclassified Pseudomonas TaxID=196821 RepID=UPI00244BE88A|nr:MULTISPECIES: histidinol-phosphate transaminase [unclassified Pseudomonas]MDH0303308.1 histidinol-phosphate aminotransferase family protein [Pseudomonas sp. GD04091]MDH1985332.1 histidinol-phosphate aminotransferase family protein [Pseudomonas sp. GD03689]
MNVDEHVLGSGLWKAPERDLSAMLLDLNENQFLHPFLARFIATELQPQDLFTYPNYRPLLSALASYCKVPTQHVLLTNGADQAIDLLLRLLFSPGDRVVIPSPVFSFYYQMLDINGLTPIVVGFEKQAHGFVLPTAAVLDALSTSQGLILCNPNNPLGARLETEQLQILVQACVRQDKPIIVDECYFEYLQQSCLDTFSEVRQLFVIRSFSKYFGLAGLRLGYVVTQPESVRELLKVRGPWDINHIAVKAALYCLRNQEDLRRAHESLDQVKGEILELCRAHGIMAYGSDTNFLLVQDHDDGRLARAFAQNGIRVSHCCRYPHSFGLLHNMLRVAIPAKSDLKAFLMALLSGAGSPAGWGEVKLAIR